MRRWLLVGASLLSLGCDTESADTSTQQGDPAQPGPGDDSNDASTPEPTGAPSTSPAPAPITPGPADTEPGIPSPQPNAPTPLEPASVVPAGPSASPGRQDLDAGSDDTSPLENDAGGIDAGALDPNCDPVGTWAVAYDRGEYSDPSDDVVFVSPSPEGQLQVTFADSRLEQSSCDFDEVPSYEEEATFDPATCVLELRLNALACNAFEFVMNRRMLTLVVNRDQARGEVGWDNYWETGGYRYYPALATRIADASACDGPAAGASCAAGAICDTGCGTACACVDGSFDCRYPDVGSICQLGEACSREAENGDLEYLECVLGEGEWPVFQGTLHEGSTCPVPAQLADGVACNDWPLGFECAREADAGAPDPCTCQRDTDDNKHWTCP